MSHTDDLLEKVRAERAAQVARFGHQHRPMLFGGPRDKDVATTHRRYVRHEELYKSVWEAQDKGRRITWDVVLLEEVYEALAETDAVKQVAELVQVAAVALAMAEDLLTGEPS